MIGRFGLPGGSREGGGSLGVSSSISAISNMSSASTQRLKSFTKKVGAGLAMSNLPNFVGDNADKKARMEAEERKALLNEVLEVLETVHLQCPLSHTGLVLAFTGSTLSPIMSPAIKFTWYRMGGGGEENTDNANSVIEQVDESVNAWYAPTVDDIGCMICAQCEDNFEQGLSRYYECGPLKADPLICSMAESALDNGSFEAQGICVSLGREQSRAVLRGEEIYASHVLSQLARNNEIGMDNSAGKGSSAAEDGAVNVGSQSATVNASAAVAYGDDTSELPTVLSKNTAFLQLDGRSTVEVDEQGVFISIPTFDNTAEPVTPQQSNGKYVNMLFNMKGGNGNGKNETKRRSTLGRKGSYHKLDKGKGKKAELHTSRRGLRIPASTKLKVVCVQPLSLVLTVPITRHSTTEEEALSNSDAKTVGDMEDNGDAEVTNKESCVENENSSANLSLQHPDKADAVETEKMRKFLSSSIVAIPWTYEGHNLSPEAYIASVSGDNISEAEKEQLLRDTERDSIVFASTVCSLAEFISTLPDGTSELLICFSCPDRYVRDTMALSIRALVCQPEGSTRHERMQVFPWISRTTGTGGEDCEGDEVNELIADANQENTADTKRRLRKREEENSTLKKERNELTRQLLEAREELVHLKNSRSSAVQSTTSTTQNDSSVGEAAAAEGSNVGGMHLSSKVIELENSLLIAHKKESENSKLRFEIEARNVKLNADVEKYQKSCEDLTRKLASVQSLYDRQSKSIELLEADQVTNNAKLEEVNKKLREMDVLRNQLKERDAQINDQRLKIQAAAEDAVNYKQLIDHQNKEKEDLSKQMDDMKVTHQSAVALLEKQLADHETEMKHMESEIKILQEKLDSQELMIAETEKIKEKLKQERSENDKLAAELNSLQRKSDSQGRDLKKVMKDNAVSLAEFEKALIRKSEECNDLYNQVQALQNQLQEQTSDRGNSNVLSSVFKGMTGGNQT